MMRNPLKVSVKKCHTNIEFSAVEKESSKPQNSRYWDGKGTMNAGEM